MPPLEGPNEEAEVEEGDEGHVILVSRVKEEESSEVKALNMQANDDKEREQRTNIFHTKGKINDNLCLFIIDSGSWTNLVSSYVVDKLKLPTQPHPRPYSLQWLNESGEAKVDRQCLVSFSIGKYRDEVLCDVSPMDAAHLILGRPWEFDRRVTHDGFTNRYHFKSGDKPIILAPL